MGVVALGAGTAGAVSGTAPAGATTGTASGGITGRDSLGPAPVLPHGAQVEGALAGSQRIQADVVLSLASPAGVAAAVSAVSTPGSPDFHHYLAPGQFAAQFGPSPATLVAVRSWLTSAGLSVGSTDPDGFVVPVSGPATAMAHAFETTLSNVRMPGGAITYSDTRAPSVPSSLSGDIRSVLGLSTADRYASKLAGFVGAPAVNRATGGRSSSESTRGGQSPDVVAESAGAPTGACAAAEATGGITQSTVVSLYGFSSLFGQGRTGAGQTIALYELEGFSASDIEQFEQCYGLAGTVSAVPVDGGPLPSAGPPGSGEAALDIENTLSFAPDARVLVYEGPNDGGVGPIDVYRQIADDDAAKVVSTSWGICEAANGTAAEQAEQQIFDQMALDGQTMVAASGDAGSADCYPSGPDPSGLAVDDPGSQPAVTSVGGTSSAPGAAAGQTVWNSCDDLGPSCATGGGRQGAGGGGVSSVWPLPAYQAAVVRAACPSGASSHSTDCREVPDVAALADPNPGYPIVWSGRWTTAGGTSAAAPLWAALFADADQGCASPLGTADPALYAIGAAQVGAFGDITSGDNDFIQTNGGEYPATVGYDLATGWGSPNAPTLLAALQPAGGCPSVTALSAHLGPLAAGSTLTVTGPGLGGATAVNLGPIGPATIVSESAGSVTVRLPAATAPVAVDLTVTTANGTSATVPADRYAFGADHDGLGYTLGAADGGIFAFGDAGYFGSMGGRHLNAPIVGVATTPDNRGYWEVAADGGIFAFGDAGYFGSMGGRHLNAPIVGIAPTPDGAGYWEVAADGGIFAFGDAGYFGSMGGRHPNAPIVGIAAKWDGRGYWEVAADGGIFAFGDAGYVGSMGGQHLNAPIVGIAASLDGAGYWEVAADGGIFAFGDAPFEGSAGGQRLVKPIVGIAASLDGAGYWEVAADGGIFAFGDAGYFGSMGGQPLVAPVVAAAST